MSWLARFTRGHRKHVEVIEDLRQSRLARLKFEQDRYELQQLKKRVYQEIDLILERWAGDVA